MCDLQMSRKLSKCRYLMNQYQLIQKYTVQQFVGQSREPSPKVRRSFLKSTSRLHSGFHFQSLRREPRIVIRISARSSLFQKQQLISFSSDSQHNLEPRSVLTQIAAGNQNRLDLPFATVWSLLAFLSNFRRSHCSRITISDSVSFDLHSV
jgi:hypothetical protein